MRNTLLISALLLVLSISTAIPFATNRVSASTSYYTADCNAASQGPGCQNTLFQDRGSVDLQSWDTAHDYETFGGEVLGLVYDTPVEYKAQPSCSDTSCISPSSAIASIDVANGTYYQFTIVPGVHAYRGNVSGGFDLGAITASDWVFSFKRAVGECAPDGPVPVVYPFLYNSSNWFNNCLNFQTNPAANQTALNKQFNDWLASKPAPLGVISSTQFFLRVDGSMVATSLATMKAYAGFLGILTDSWAGVYPKATMEKLCGALTSHLDLLCDGTNGAVGNLESNKIGIGTGPYLVDETASTPTTIVLNKNAHYCDARPEPKCSSPAVGGPTQANRVGKIVFNTVSDETVRRSDLLAGRVDEATISSVNLPYFLNASTTPPFNALINTAYWNNLTNGRVPDYNFYVYNTIIIQHAGLLVSNFVGSGYVAANGHKSPLWGDCAILNPGNQSGCNVRAAIQAAFSYGVYFNTIRQGLDTPEAGFIPVGLQGDYASAVAAGYLSYPSQNKTLARQLFATAGYNMNNTLTLTCAYNVENKVRQQFCAQLASDLVKIKDFSSTPTAFITVSSVTETFGRYVIDAFVNAKWDITTLGWAPDYTDPDDYSRPYALSSGTFAFPSGYRNTTLDNEIITASTTVGAARSALYFDMQRQINKEHAYIWLGQPHARTVFTADITGFSIRGTNVGFLPFERDVTKSLLTGIAAVTSTPIFGSALPTLMLLAATTFASMWLLKRTSTRKIRLN